MLRPRGWRSNSSTPRSASSSLIASVTDDCEIDRFCAAPRDRALLGDGDEVLQLAKREGHDRTKQRRKPLWKALSAQPSLRATTPVTIPSAAAARQPVIFSPSAKTEISMANRIEDSRSAATEAIGALVIAHMAIQ